MIPRTIIALAALLLLNLCASTTSAQGGQEDEARVHFEQGVKLYEEGQHEQAAIAFARAYEIAPSYKILFNIGQAESELKHYALALEAFTRYLAEGGDEVPPDRAEVVASEIKRLNALVGMVEVECDIVGAKIKIDNETRGETPLKNPIFVDIGKHEVVVSQGKEELMREVLRVAGGQTVTLEVAGDGVAVPDDDTEPEDVTEEPPGSSGKKIAGWVLIGVGSALAVGGSITGVGALKLDKKITGDCTESDGCLDVDRSDDVKRRNALALTTDILIGVGAAAFVTGILLLTVFDGDEEPDSSDVAVVPLVGHDLAGAAMEWRF